MFEKLSDNLNLLMAEAHISADELGRRTNLPASTIKKIRNRNNPNPTLASLLPLAHYFAITLSQLVGDEPLPSLRKKGTYQINPKIVRQVPLLSWQEVILWPATKKKTYSTISTEFEYNENSFALVVEEDDWENMAKGTALIIDPSLKPEHRDFIIVHKEGQSLPTLKQILFDEDHVYLKPIIHGYNVVTFSPEHKLLGIVVEYKKNLRNQNFLKNEVIETSI